MILGVEAINIRNGGGLNHLIKFLENSCKQNFYKKIIVFTNSNTTLKIRHIKGIKIVKKKIYDLPFPIYLIYHLLFFKKDLLLNKCDLVFVPGSIFFIKFPNVLMPQNMLAFEKNERNRFSGFKRLKFILIGFAQKISLQKTNGVIYLSNYAFQKINIYSKSIKNIIIPHGVVPQNDNVKKIKTFNKKNPLELLYVSPLYPYKHHENIILSVMELLEEGFNINYTIVGGGSKKSIKRLKKLISNQKIKYYGEVSPQVIPLYYKSCDVFIFGSTCENLPITVLEAMSFGLPIICSNHGVMPEIIYNKSIFLFDPLNKESIKNVIKKAYLNTDILNLEAKENRILSSKFNWEENILKTNNFLKETYFEAR